jgi:hypothetical protein
LSFKFLFLLVCEVCGQGDGDGHEGEGEVDGLGAVAAVSLALAHERVVLLEDSLPKTNEILSAMRMVDKFEMKCLPKQQKDIISDC